MFESVQLLTFITLICFIYGEPWKNDKTIREFDLQWQCEQFCDRINGKLTYNTSDSSCTCTVNNNNIDIDTNLLENKLNNLGFNFKVVDRTKSNKINKRETAAENLKRLLEEKKENDLEINGNENIHKLRLKLLGSKLKNIESKTEEKPMNDNIQAIKTKIEEKPINDKIQQLKLRLQAAKSMKHVDNSVVKEVPPEQTTVAEEKEESKLDKLKHHNLHPLRRNLKVSTSKLSVHNNNQAHVIDKVKEMREKLREYIQSRRLKSQLKHNNEDNIAVIQQ